MIDESSASSVGFMAPLPRRHAGIDRRLPAGHDRAPGAGEVGYAAGHAATSSTCVPPRPDRGEPAPPRPGRRRRRVDEVRAIVADVRDGGDAALRRVHGPIRQGRDRRDPRPCAEIGGGARAPAAGPSRSARGGRGLHRGIPPLTAARAAGTYERNGIPVELLELPVELAPASMSRAGSPSYPSSVLMTRHPARGGRRRRRVLCVPPGPRRQGPRRDPRRRRTSPAWTRSTGSVARKRSPPWRTGRSRSLRVDVIVGAGNRYVSLAKQEVRGVVGVPSAFAGPVRGRRHRRRHRPGRLCRHRRRRPGRARPRRSGMARHLVGGRARRPSTSRRRPLVETAPRRGRDRLDARARRLRRARRRPGAGHGSRQRDRPRAPRAVLRRSRATRAARAQRRGRLPRPVVARHRSATTSPGRATCFRRFARLDSPACSASRTSCAGCTSSSRPRSALARRPARGARSPAPRASSLTPSP